MIHFSCWLFCVSSVLKHGGAEQAGKVSSINFGHFLLPLSMRWKVGIGNNWGINCGNGKEELPPIHAQLSQMAFLRDTGINPGKPLLQIHLQLDKLLINYKCNYNLGIMGRCYGGEG